MIKLTSVDIYSILQIQSEKLDKIQSEKLDKFILEETSLQNIPVFYTYELKLVTTINVHSIYNHPVADKISVSVRKINYDAI